VPSTGFDGAELVVVRTTRYPVGAVVGAVNENLIVEGVIAPSTNELA